MSNRFWDEDSEINPRLFDDNQAGDMPPTEEEIKAFKKANIVDSFLDSEDEEESDNDTIQQELSPVLVRIQMAKLYEMLITHKLIAEGSASPEIIKKVQDEAKAFFMGRLKNLLGISKDSEQSAASQQEAKLPFSKDQVEALKAMANRLIEKTKTPSAASVVEPKLMPLGAKPEHRQEIKPKKRPVQQVVSDDQSSIMPVGGQPAQQQQQQQQEEKPKRSLQQQKIPGKVLPSKRKPLAMPSQAHMDAMNAEQISKSLDGNPGTNKLIGLLTGKK